MGRKAWLLVADPPSSKSNAVAAYVKAALVAHLGEYLTDALAECAYHLGDGRFLKAAQVPCIYIDDQGSTVTNEGSIGGWDEATHTRLPGYQTDRYRLDIQIFRKGLHSEAMRVELNEWRDSVAACLRKYWDFAAWTGDITLRDSDPAFPFELESAKLWGAVVHVEADGRSWQGSVYLMGDEP